MIQITVLNNFLINNCHTQDSRLETISTRDQDFFSQRMIRTLKRHHNPLLNTNHSMVIIQDT